MSRNYYSILGVSIDSSQREIEAAYRKLTKKIQATDREDGQVPLGAVQEAYSVLNRQELREIYDSTLKERENMQTHHIPSSGERKSSPNPLKSFVPMQSQITVNQEALTKFEDRLLSRSEDKWYLQGLNFETLSMEVSLTPEQAEQGGQLQLVIPVLTNCTNCKGRGDSVFFPCRPCRGSGIVTEKRSIPVNYPPNLQNNSSIHLSFSDGDICNLLLVVHFKFRTN